MRYITVFVFVLVLSFGAFDFAGAEVINNAEVVGSLGFDNTDVTTDLEEFTVEGKLFDIGDYPYGEIVDFPRFFAFVEYAYTFKRSLQGNFGMYLYIYNPSGLDINVAGYFNKVQMATAYESGEPVFWEKFGLEFCSKTLGEYLNLFYKFRIIDRIGSDGKTVLERVNAVSRRYDISGVELAYFGAENAVDYEIGGTFVFTGYAKGYGVSVYDDSTLAMTASGFETASLDCYGTFWRTNSSSAGRGHKNQLNSVYFSVDNDIAGAYGALTRIVAETWAYRTKDIVVTESSVVFDRFIDYIGVLFERYNSDIGRSLYLNYVIGYEYASAEWSLNPKIGLFNFDYSEADKFLFGIADCLYYLFKVADIRADVVSGEDLRDWIMSYSVIYGNGSGGTLPIKDGIVSADLFVGGGYMPIDIDVGDKFDLFVYDDGWFQTFIDYGFVGLFDWLWQSKLDFGVDVTDIKPIVEVLPSDFVGSVKEISNRLFVDESDVSDFYTYFEAERDEGRRVYLFRYAVTDYYAEDLSIYGNVFMGEHWDDQAYLARETVFFDFDVIFLTFTRDGVDTVIPVVSSPIDIFADIESPLYAEDKPVFWLFVAVLGAVIAGAVILMSLLKSDNG